MIATGKDLYFHVINPFRLQQNYLFGFICAPGTCFFPSTKRGGRHVTGTEDRNAAPGPWCTGLASFQLGFMPSAHRHLCNQQLFPSVCPSRWTSFSRSTWCRETSPRRSTACETWRSLTSTTSWCTRCVGRDSYAFVLLPGWWAGSDRRRRGPVLQIHKIKPNPITNNLMCELSQDQAFVCFAWLICFFVFFSTDSKTLILRQKSKLRAAQWTSQRISSLFWPVTLPAEEEFLLETSISVSCQGHCVFGRLGCIVCINGPYSKWLSQKWQIKGETCCIEKPNKFGMFSVYFDKLLFFPNYIK